MQDVLPENIERIEVISGPAGTLWGANAVNGVINIVTRKASDTRGGNLDLGAGDQESSAALQYGGKLDGDLAYRVYARDFYQRAFNSTPRVSAHDGWSKPQGGFRLDWTPQNDSLTLEGDLYGGAEAQLGTPNQVIGGGNLTATWQHALENNSNLQVLTYYDETERSTVNGGAFTLNTYDFEFQNNFSLGGWNNIVWGAGERADQYRITDRISPASSLLFIPPARVLESGRYFRRRSHPPGRPAAAGPGSEDGERPLFRLVADAQCAAVLESDGQGSSLGCRVARHPFAHPFRCRCVGETGGRDFSQRQS